MENMRRLLVIFASLCLLACDLPGTSDDCIPWCGDFGEAECGADGCGGSCGQCESGAICGEADFDAIGICFTPAKTCPGLCAEAGAECGSVWSGLADPEGCDCGECAAGLDCEEREEGYRCVDSN